ncbi:MAG: ATP synthase F0 subunit C [Deltaproteobacteria bacterium]|nr:ATP synthase F0 subunit C [Deltaproteobacteria bacterium]
MKKFSVSSVLGFLFVLALVGTALAAEAAAVDYTKAAVVCVSIFTAGLAVGLAALGTGIGMGNGVSGATNSIGRNPEASGKVMVVLMVGLAMIESLAIYALVIALIALYANPLLKVIGA